MAILRDGATCGIAPNYLDFHVAFMHIWIFKAQQPNFDVYHMSIYKDLYLKI